MTVTMPLRSRCRWSGSERWTGLSARLRRIARCGQTFRRRTGAGSRNSEDSPVVGDAQAATGAYGVAHRALHPGVGGDDEVAGCPRANPEQDTRRPVHALANTLFGEQEKKPTAPPWPGVGQ